MEAAILGCAERTPSIKFIGLGPYSISLLFIRSLSHRLFYQVFVAEKLVPGFAVLMDVVQVIWLGFHCVFWRQSFS